MMKKTQKSLLILFSAGLFLQAQATDTVSKCLGSNFSSLKTESSIDIAASGTRNDAAHLDFSRTQCQVMDDGVLENRTELLMTVTPTVVGKSNIACFYSTLSQGGQKESENFNEIPRMLSGVSTYVLESSEVPVSYYDVDLTKAFSMNLACAQTQYSSTFAALSGSATGAISDPTGAWYDPSLSGIGFNLATAPNGVYTYYYGYDKDGKALWLLSDVVPGTIVKNQAINLIMYQAAANNGANFNQSPTIVNGLSEWGSLSLTFSSCSAAQATLTGKDGTQNFDLVLLSAPPSITCTEN